MKINEAVSHIISTLTGESVQVDEVSGGGGSNFNYALLNIGGSSDEVSGSISVPWGDVGVNESNYTSVSSSNSTIDGVEYSVSQQLRALFQNVLGVSDLFGNADINIYSINAGKVGELLYTINSATTEAELSAIANEMGAVIYSNDSSYLVSADPETRTVSASLIGFPGNKAWFTSIINVPQSVVDGFGPLPGTVEAVTVYSSVRDIVNVPVQLTVRDANNNTIGTKMIPDAFKRIVSLSLGVKIGDSGYSGVVMKL